MNKRYLLWICAAATVPAAIVGMRCLEGRLEMGCCVPVNKKLTAARTDFAIRLFKEATADKGNRNVVISPCGVSFALALAHRGALENTRTAMARALGVTGMKQSEIDESSGQLMTNLERPGAGVTLAVANAVWLSKRAPVEASYVRAAAKYYRAEVTNLDLAGPGAASTINKWARKKTNGRIDGIAEGLDHITVLCLTNAVYFKGAWAHRFDKDRTQSMSFTPADGTVKTVPMMCQEGKFRYLQADAFDAAALPYGSGRASMLVFVPNRNSTLSAFLHDLSANNWALWISRFRETRIRVLLPRWKLECRTQLKDPCVRLGMGIAFDPNRSNFRGMCKCESRDNVYIDALTQKALIEVSEEGTEAAAVTLGVFKARSGCPEFRADRPFFYAIRDDSTGEILFMGTLADPTLL